MKEIKLKRIVLKDWKSLNLDVSFNGGLTKISGKNGIGKSSLQSAWNWLLTSYTNSVSPKNHELFDNRVELSHETPIASVKAWMEVDGMEYTLERTAQAKFTRKRGSNEYEKASSDVYVTKIDEIECSANEFAKWIETNICDSNMLVYLLDGNFFSTLSVDDKNKARKVLEALVGEIYHYDMKGDYASIAQGMAKYGLDGLRERAKATIKPLKSRILEVDAEIKAKEKECAECSTKDYQEILRQINDIQNKITEIDNTMLGRMNELKPLFDEKQKIRKEIENKESLLANKTLEYSTLQKSKKADLLGQISQVDKHNQAIKIENEKAANDYEYNSRLLEAEKNTLNTLMEQRAILIKKRDEVKLKIFDGDKCAYCGQELPYEILESAKKDFNEIKQRELDNIVAQGKSVKEKIELSEKRIQELCEVQKTGLKVQPYESKEELEQQLKELEESYVPFEQTDEANKLISEIDLLKQSLKEKDDELNNGDIVERKKELMSTLNGLNMEYSVKIRMDILVNAIEELKSEKFKLGCQIAEQEGVLDKISEYLNERANIVAERINGRLNGCYIDMYRTQKDGTKVEDCVIKSKDRVNFATLNNSARILINIQLQHLFMSHYGVELPTFIDECSVFDSQNRPKIQHQNIMLFASDDQTLKVE